MDSGPLERGKHSRFIDNEEEELVEAVNASVSPIWLSKASAMQPPKPSSCLITDEDLLETAEAINEAVDMDEEAASNARPLLATPII